MSTTYNDVIVRPIYSEWEKEPGEDAVYISWHTNGYNGYNTIARGTEILYLFFDAHAEQQCSAEFHPHRIDQRHSHAAGMPAGPIAARRPQDLGELRLLSTMPGVLIENGFHDNPTDVEAMKDPRFLQLSARAIYHGLVRYWHSIDPNVPLVYSARTAAASDDAQQRRGADHDRLEARPDRWERPARRCGHLLSGVHQHRWLWLEQSDRRRHDRLTRSPACCPIN